MSLACVGSNPTAVANMRLWRNRSRVGLKIRWYKKPCGCKSHQPHQWGCGEMVYTSVLETDGEGHASSSLAIPTNKKSRRLAIASGDTKTRKRDNYSGPYVVVVQRIVYLIAIQRIGFRLPITTPIKNK